MNRIASFLGTLLVLIILAPTQSAQVTGSITAGVTFTVLHSFGGSDGANPIVSLIRDSAGNLYGTAQNGGTSNLGVVFELPASGTFTVLHSFGGSDGANPQAALIQDSAGNLYGTTAFGGASNVGVVFELIARGPTFKVLHNFAGSDGANPTAGLIRDSAGNLYGTASHGGSCGLGVVFELPVSGTFSLLHNFCGGSGDGAYPDAGLVRDSTGNLYSTTSNGGPINGGTVFKLTPSGIFTLMHSFAGGATDGQQPNAGLIMDSGSLYGTTQNGGTGPCFLTYSGCGLVFKITPSGTETVLYSFAGPPTDGANPERELIRDAAGNLYGTTAFGGASGAGTVFGLTLGGTETVIYSFSGADGADPITGLVHDSVGNLYGTTQGGGSSDLGVVFKLHP
jgi:uncharacterized repeat protein (TIGR03803 family)